jgi:hypothetical protein
MNKKVVVTDCPDCQFYEGHYANGKLMKQICYKMDVEIHRNINMDFAENCPLEDDIIGETHDTDNGG